MKVTQDGNRTTPRKCASIGCDRRAVARVLCHMHYMSWLRTGGKQERVIIADLDGYSAGLANRHYEYKSYATSEEYVAWLAGWRRGQQMRRSRVAA